MITVVWSKPLPELEKRLAVLSLALSGKEATANQIASDVAMAIGFAALSDINADFIVKSRKGVGKIFGKWAKLSPITIANRRIGPKDLKNQDIALRKKIVDKWYKHYLPIQLASHPEPIAKKRAKAFAEKMATKLTGKTKVATLGDRDVEILRDTGRGFNSLSPGVVAPSPNGWTYVRPTTDGGADQVFDVKPGSVTIGTNVDYMAYHQTGTSRMPARPFLPRKNEVIPQDWVDNWRDAARSALLLGLERYFS